MNDTQQQTTTQTQEQQPQATVHMASPPPARQMTPIQVIQTHFLKENVMQKIAQHCEIEVSGVERIVRDLVNAIRSSQDEELQYCTPASFVNCIYDAHALGMRIDARRHCYLVRYKNEATLAPSYKGYVNRLKQSLEGFDIQTFIWFEEGEFSDSSKDGVASYEYKPKPKNRTRSDYVNALGCAVYISYWEHGEKKAVVEVIGKEEIAKIKSKAKTAKVWSEWFGEQMKKATVRRACKLRFSLITDDLDALDNEHYDLEGGAPAEPRAKASDRFNEKMGSDKYNPFPGDGPIIEATATEAKPEGDGAEPANNEPVSQEKPQESAENAPAPTTKHTSSEPKHTTSPEEVVLFADVPEWNGNLILLGEGKQHKTINSAYGALVSIMTKQKGIEARKALVEENPTLLASLYRHQRKIYDSLIELVQKGQQDEAQEG